VREVQSATGKPRPSVALGSDGHGAVAVVTRTEPDVVLMVMTSKPGRRLPTECRGVAASCRSGSRPHGLFADAAQGDDRIVSFGRDRQRTSRQPESATTVALLKLCFTDELAARDADRAGIPIILGTPEAAGRVMFIG
jgi:hypothetical protein